MSSVNVLKGNNISYTFQISNDFSFMFYYFPSTRPINFNVISFVVIQMGPDN